MVTVRFDPDPDEPPAPLLDPPGWDVSVDRTTLGDTNVVTHPIGFQRRWPQVWPAP